MALTGRDIMFTLRAQDMASRQVRNLAGSFGSLDRQLRAVNTRMSGELATATRKHADDMSRLANQSKRVNQGYKNKIASINQYRDQGLNKTTDAYKKQMAAIKERESTLKPEREARIAAAHRSTAAAVHMATQAYKRQQDQRSSKINDTLHRRDERVAGIKNEQARAIARVKGEYQKVSHALGSHNDRLRTMNARINEQIALNRSLTNTDKRRLSEAQKVARTHIAQNTERINAARRVAAIEQQTIRANAKADEQATKREAARRVETIKHAQTTAQAKHNAHIAHLRGIEAAEVRAAREDYARNKQRLENARRHLTAVRDSEQQGLRRAAEARVAALQQEQQHYARRVQMTREAVKQRFEIERAHVRALAEYQTRELMRRQAQVQRAMMGGAALSMVGGLMVGAGAKGINALRSMAREAAEFNRVIALALTQVDGFKTSVGELSAIALRVSREIPAAMDTIPQTLYFLFSSLNVGIESAENLLRGFAKEAVAGNTTIEASAKSTMAILNGMGLVTQDVAQMQANLTRVQDMQFQTVRKGVITYEQLSKNIGKLIPALRRTGQEIEMGGAMLAFLTRNGLSAEMAATAAARSLELIGDPRVVKRMEDMGLTVRDDVTGEFVALDVIINQLADSFAGMPGPERAQAMLDLFGGAGYRIQARRFFDTVIPGIESFNEHVAWATDNVGAFDRAYKTMLDTPAAKAQLLTNNVQALRIEFGEKLFPIMMQLVDVGRRLVDWVDRLDDSLDGNLGTMIAYGSAAVALIGTLTLVGGLFLTLGSLIAMATGKGVILSTVLSMGVLGALAAVAAAAAYLIMNFDSMSDVIDRVREYFSGADGIFRLVVVSLTAMTTAGWIWVATAGSMELTSKGLVSNFKHMRTGIINAARAISNFAYAHPILLVLTALTAAAVLAYRDFTRETRELNEATKEHQNSLKGVGDTISSSMESFNRRHELMRNAAHDAAMASLEEKGLEDAMRSVTELRRGGYVDAIIGTTAEREVAIKAVEREIAAYENQLSTMERFVKWSDQFSWFGDSDFGQLEHLNNLKKLSAELDRQAEASKRAREAEFLRLEQKGEGAAIIADFLRMEEGIAPSTMFTRHAQLQLVIALLETTDAFKDLDPEMQAMILGNEHLADSVGEAAEEIQNIDAIASSLFETLAQITAPTATWQAALDKLTEANNALEEPLANVTVGLGDWMAAMEEATSKTTAMFRDMRTLWTANTEATREDVNQTIAAVLAMGDSGPEAMALLAQADPKDFLEVMRQIQFNAALTSENVQKHMNDMVVGMEIIADDYASISDKQWNNIFEATVISADRHGDIMEGITDDMMVALAASIEGGGKWSVTEMIQLGDLLAMAAEDGGDNAVRGLLDALENGTGGIEDIMDSYSYAIKRGLDPVLLSLGRPGIKLGGMLARNAGGIIPGRGPDRDSVLTALTPGEFVLRRKAVDSLDLHSLETLNRTGDINTLVRRYNEGGFVTSGDIPKPPANYGKPTYPFVAPAFPADKRKYDEAKRFMDSYAPPLSAGIGWQAMWRAVSNRFPTVNLHSAFRPGAITATGNPSYHGQGRAIDISPRMDIFNWLVDRYRNSREIIFSPANSRQIHNGRNHMYSGITRQMHFDHIHWAMRNGGIINEPIIGQGLSTGSMYSFGEGGHPEQVTPVGATGNIEDKLDALINLLAEREPLQVNVSTKDDPDDFARRSATALKARM